MGIAMGIYPGRSHAVRGGKGFKLLAKIMLLYYLWIVVTPDNLNSLFLLPLPFLLIIWGTFFFIFLSLLIMKKGDQYHELHVPMTEFQQYSTHCQSCFIHATYSHKPLMAAFSLAQKESVRHKLSISHRQPVFPVQFLKRPKLFSFERVAYWGRKFHVLSVGGYSFCNPDGTC